MGRACSIEVKRTNFYVARSRTTFHNFHNSQETKKIEVQEPKIEQEVFEQTKVAQRKKPNNEWEIPPKPRTADEIK